jgi:hypothetical protein
MSAAVARPVASSSRRVNTCIYLPVSPNLPLTNYTKVSSKCLPAT